MKKKAKVIALIQSRMGSSRLPGKPLKKIGGKPMVEFIAGRLKKCRLVDQVCVATTRRSSDDKLAAFLKRKKIPYSRGANEDIVGRLDGACRKFKADWVVRVWGDCPLIDPVWIDRMVLKSLKNKKPYTTNNIPLTFPFGLNAEIYSGALLRYLAKNLEDPFFREFPNRWMRQQKEFKINRLRLNKDYSHIHLTVDYPVDLKTINIMVADMKKANENFGLKDIVRYYSRHKAMFKEMSAQKRNPDFIQKAKRRIKTFLVIGCGSIGQRHLKNLLAQKAGRLLAYDIDPSRFVEVRKISSNIACLTELKACWESKPDAVFITTPTSLHVPYALKAAKQGCHLFIEKPLSHNMRGLDSLLDIVGKKRLVTFIGYNNAFSQCLNTVKKILQSGIIGPLISAKTFAGSYLPDRHPTQDYSTEYGARRILGGGVILDTLSHHVFNAGFLFGEVKEIFCWADRRTSLKTDVEDTAELLIKFHENFIMQCHADYIMRPTTRTMDVIGEKGAIVCDLLKGVVKVYEVKKNRWQVFCRAKEIDAIYKREIACFVQCVNGDADSPIDLEKGIRIQHILHKMKQSNRLKRWVRICD